MADLLNIRGLEIDLERIIETQTETTIGVKRRPKGLMACPHCGVLDPAPNGSRRVYFRDVALRGKPTTLEWDRQRFRCSSCGQSSSDEHHELLSDRLMTRRLFEWMGNRCTEHTFASVARDAGVDPKTVRNVFDEWSVVHTRRWSTIRAPVILGMDEVPLLKRARGVLTDIGESTLIDMLPSRTRDAMARRVAAFPDKERVEVVVMDMWRPYLDIARAILPRAIVVADKWHVLKYANEGIEFVRKNIRKGLSAKRRRRLLHDRFLLNRRPDKLQPNERMILEAWTNEFPALGEAYAAKERFYDIYNARSEAEAREMYVEWERTLPETAIDAFKPLTTAVSDWDGPIFNHFKRRETNAFTESMNGQIKRTNSNGRGYSFDVLRARMMTRYRAADRYGEEPGLSLTDIGMATSIRPFLGAHLPTLINVMEQEFDRGDSTDKSG